MHYYISCYLNCVQAHKNQSNLALISRLKCAAGLAEMEGRKYKNAARYYLQVSFDHFQCPDVSVIIITFFQQC